MANDEIESLIKIFNNIKTKKLYDPIKKIQINL